MDIRTVETKTINPNETVIFRTNIAFDIPVGYDIKIYSRSGLAAKRSIFVLNAPAVIDKDYVGEIMIILHNAGKESATLNAGDRIAQCILEQKNNMVLNTIDELPLTERGDNGFGSTGLK
jgi:dUTP pyrophosphatase